MNKMFIANAAHLPVVQFQKDWYPRNQHNLLYQNRLVLKIFMRVTKKGRTLPEGLRCGKNYVRRPNFGYFNKPISVQENGRGP